MKYRALFFLLPSVMLVGAGCSTGPSKTAPALPASATDRVAPSPVPSANQAPTISPDAKNVPKPVGY